MTKKTADNLFDGVMAVFILANAVFICVPSIPNKWLHGIVLGFIALVCLNAVRMWRNTAHTILEQWEKAVEK